MRGGTILIKQYFDQYFKINPGFAYHFGYKQYEKKETILSDSTFKKTLELDKKILKKINNLSDKEKKKLSPSDLIDLKLFKAHLELSISEAKYDYRLKNPEIFLPHNTIQMFLISNLKNKKQIIISRIPDQIKNLKIGRKIIEKSNKLVDLWTRNAINIASNDGIFEELRKLKLSKAEKQLIDQIQNEVILFNEIMKSKLPKAKETFAIGKGRFVKTLKKARHIKESPEEILKFGQRELKKYKSAMQKIAKKHKCSIQEYQEKIEKKGIKANEIVKISKKITDDARNFIIKKKLFEINHKEKLHVRKTPDQLAHQLPAAAYIPPRMDDKSQKGEFFITVPKGSKILKHMNLHELKITAVHEAYPGHHLQMSTIHNTKYKNSIIRNFLSAITFVEGWGLYSEKLMVDEGFAKSDQDKFVMYKMRVMRACRIIVDINMQINGWSYQKAWKFLQKHTLMPKERAMGECFWYTQRPAYPLSYLVGCSKIESARDELVKKGGMSYIDFHSKMLSFGNIPVDLIVEQIKRDYQK